jgi:hypothetical protein
VSIEQYTSRHAEPEHRLGRLLEAQYSAVVVVPMCDEHSSSVDRILTSLGDRSLCVVVVNGRDSLSASTHAVNQRLLQNLRASCEKFGSPGLSTSAYLGRRRGTDLLLVDRASPGSRLPEGEGVGLARKIGCDIAVAAHASGSVASPWIHSTDADVTLPSDYLSGVEAAGTGVGCVTYRFTHETAALPPPADRALHLYELSLRYYVVGLARAGSPYAAHTIGSTLAFDVDAYVAVRGMPRRQAAEDFYLVNKLAKVAGIERVAPRITLHGRPSERVPFGTGPAIRRIAAALAAGEPFRLYHPDSFALVGEWLGHMERLAAGDDDALAGAPALLREALAATGTSEKIRKLRRGCTSVEQARRRAHEHFDGFKTLKLIHALRDRGLGMIPWREAVSTWGLEGETVREIAEALEAMEPDGAGL